jgi:hypothetical protein
MMTLLEVNSKGLSKLSNHKVLNLAIECLIEIKLDLKILYFNLAGASVHKAPRSRLTKDSPPFM